MKKTIIVLIVLLVAAGLLYWGKDYLPKDYFGKLFGKGNQFPSPEKQLNISVRDGMFLPNLSAANKGITFVWYNDDSKEHEIVGEGWSSGKLQPNQTFKKTFGQAGDFKYHCSLHPEETGEIIIQ